MLKRKHLRKTTPNRHNSKGRFGSSGFTDAMIVALISVLFSSLSTFVVSKLIEKERQDFEIYKDKITEVTEVISFCTLLQMDKKIVMYSKPTGILSRDQYVRLDTTQKGKTNTVESSIVEMPAILYDSTSRFQMTKLLDKWLSSPGIFDPHVYLYLRLLRSLIESFKFPQDYDLESIMNSDWGDSTVRNIYFRIIHELKYVAEKSLEKN